MSRPFAKEDEESITHGEMDSRLTVTGVARYPPCGLSSRVLTSSPKSAVALRNRSCSRKPCTQWRRNLCSCMIVCGDDKERLLCSAKNDRPQVESVFETNIDSVVTIYD